MTIAPVSTPASQRSAGRWLSARLLPSDGPSGDDRGRSADDRPQAVQPPSRRSSGGLRAAATEPRVRRITQPLRRRAESALATRALACLD